MRALLVGLAVTNESVAGHLVRRGWDVTVVEDHPSAASRERAGRLAGVHVELVEQPSPTRLDELVDVADVVIPTPGVPITHPAVQRALGRRQPVWSEFELVARWSSVPMVAVTGTNGKTTVVGLIEAMLAGSGLRTVAAGNNELPLVDALDRELDVIVVEASSFRLEFTETFRPAVGVWLNLAEDHLDWHPTMQAYAAAKAKLWAHQRGDDVALANADDPVVMAHARGVRARLVTFGEGADWRVEADQLVGPDGPFLGVGELWRSLPHDCVDALAAAAAATYAGATPDAVAGALRSFRGLPHRVALVGEHGGVRWYDDSKATDPHAALTAIRAFDTVVLVAGGRNKGLDLSVLAEEAERIRAVVAIGEAAGEVAAAFEGRATVVTAASMDEAVSAAAGLAEPGDAVLLSPACASFDWYRNYGERGDDFVRAVNEVVGAP